MGGFGILIKFKVGQPLVGCSIHIPHSFQRDIAGLVIAAGGRESFRGALDLPAAEGVALAGRLFQGVPGFVNDVQRSTIIADGVGCRNLVRCHQSVAGNGTEIAPAPVHNITGILHRCRNVRQRFALLNLPNDIIFSFLPEGDGVVGFGVLVELEISDPVGGCIVSLPHSFQRDIAGLVIAAGVREDFRCTLDLPAAEGMTLAGGDLQGVGTAVEHGLAFLADHRVGIDLIIGHGVAAGCLHRHDDCICGNGTEIASAPEHIIAGDRRDIGHIVQLRSAGNGTDDVPLSFLPEGDGAVLLVTAAVLKLGEPIVVCRIRLPHSNQGQVSQLRVGVAGGQDDVSAFDLPALENHADAGGFFKSAGLLIEHFLLCPADLCVGIPCLICNGERVRNPNGSQRQVGNEVINSVLYLCGAVRNDPPAECVTFTGWVRQGEGSPVGHLLRGDIDLGFFLACVVEDGVLIRRLYRFNNHVLLDAGEVVHTPGNCVTGDLFDLGHILQTFSSWNRAHDVWLSFLSEGDRTGF